MSAPASADSLGHITGTVTGADHQPIGGVRVIASKWHESHTTYTKADGTYDLTTYPATFQLRFDDPTHATEWWDDTYNEDEATGITVTADSTVTGKDAVLAEAGSISGIITDPQDGGIANGRVFAYLKDGDTWDSISSADTDSAGQYQFPKLPIGTYRLQFTASLYADKYSGDAPTLDTATDVTVTPGGSLTGLDTQLVPGARMSGLVTGPTGDGAEGVEVAAFLHTGDEWLLIQAVHSRVYGPYLFRGLPLGTYRLRFRDDSGADDFVTEYSGNATTLETAADIEVAGGEVVLGTNAELALIPQPPIGNTAPPNISGTPQLGVPLTASTGSWDVTGGMTYNYRWLVDGAWTQSGPDPSYTPTVSDVGKTVRVTVTAKRGRFTTSTAVTSPATAVVAPGPAPVNQTLPTILGTPRVGETITADAGTWATADDLSYDYQWLVDDTPVATGPSFTPVADDLGEMIRVHVIATRDGYTPGTADSAATTAVVAGAAPINNTQPTITGTPRVGVTVTASPGTWTPTGATIGYQWLVAGVPVSTQASYTPRPVDADKSLQVRVTRSAPGRTPATASSAAASIATGRLKATKKPSLTGAAKKNATLIVNRGTWTPNAVTVACQWYANGKRIAGATATRLKLSGKTLRATAGKTISVKVTVRATGYSTTVVTLMASAKSKP